MSDYNELKAVEIAERYQGALTSMRIVEIGSEELPARFSLMYLKTLHAKIFQDFQYFVYRLHDIVLMMLFDMDMTYLYVFSLTN